MNKRFVCAAAIALWTLLPAALFAQHDLSLWNRSGYGENVAYPWYLYLGSKVTFDARYNFDQKETGAAYVGKTFGNAKLTAVPAAGVLFGKYNGISPQLYLMVNTGRLSLFTMHQYVKRLGSESNDFQYHWIDALFIVNKHLSVGPDYQVYHEPNSGYVEHDLGPSAKYVITSIPVGEKCKLSPYLRAWYARSLGPENSGSNLLFLTIGASF
jgi:hypothetical protein